MKQTYMCVWRWIPECSKNAGLTPSTSLQYSCQMKYKTPIQFEFQIKKEYFLNIMSQISMGHVYLNKLVSLYLKSHLTEQPLFLFDKFGNPGLKEAH